MLEMEFKTTYSESSALAIFWYLMSFSFTTEFSDNFIFILQVMFLQLTRNFEQQT